MWRCLWVLKNFPVILPKNDGGNGGGGGVEVLVRGYKSRKCMRENKNEKKERQRVSCPKKRQDEVNCVVGSEVRWGTWEPKNLILTFPLKKKKKKTGTLQACSISLKNGDQAARRNAQLMAAFRGSRSFGEIKSRSAYSRERSWW